MPDWGSSPPGLYHLSLTRLQATWFHLGFRFGGTI